MFRYEIQQNGAVTRELVADFNADYAESSWLAVGDADNDGIDDLVLATGKGDRTLPGVSYVIVLHEHGVREKRAAN